MNLYIKKISTLAGVGVISILSTFQTFTNAEAALTAPTIYDIAYTSVSGAFIMTAPGYTINSTYPLFTRTADSTYFNYTHNFSSGQHTNTSNFDLPQGLDITMIFNRSNTSWTDASSAGYTGYYATDTKIGSDATVGSVFKKVAIEFSNQTNKDYRLFLDISSAGAREVYISYLQGVDRVYFNKTFMSHTTLREINVFSYNTTKIEFESTSSTMYLDAWYLRDLGESASWQAGISQGYIDGYDDGLGNNPNVLINGFSAMVGILVNFMLLILNLEAFGISILSVFGVLAFFVGVIWFFKLLRG